MEQDRILGLAKSTSIFIALIALGNWDIPVGVVTVLRSDRPRKLGLIPGKCKRYLSSGQHADWPVTTLRVLFDEYRIKRPGHETLRSTPYYPEVIYKWKYTSTPPYSFIPCCCIKHVKYVNSFSPSGSTAPRGPRPPHYRGFTITLRHTTLGRTPLDE